MWCEMLSRSKDKIHKVFIHWVTKVGKVLTLRKKAKELKGRCIREEMSQTLVKGEVGQGRGL